MSLLGLMFAGFLTLKLAGVTDMAWVWVLGPIWIPLGCVVVALIVMVPIAGVAHAVAGIKQKRRVRRMIGRR